MRMSRGNRRSRMLVSRVPRNVRLCCEPLEDRNLLSTCTVDRPTDNNSLGTGEGSGATGDLRYCVYRENADTNGVINFTTAGPVTLINPLPFLASSMSIAGPGGGIVIQRFQDSMNPFRILGVSAGIDVTMSRLTITGGYLFSNDPRGSALQGAGILNHGNLTLNTCDISQNLITGMPDIDGVGIYNDGVLQVNDSSIHDNTGTSTSRVSPIAEGGGIFNARQTPDTPLPPPPQTTVSNSLIYGNILNTGTLPNIPAGLIRGAGIYNGGIEHAYVGVSYEITITASRITQNQAVGGDGGGIFSDGHVSIEASWIDQNIGSGLSVGAESVATDVPRASIANTTFSYNTANGDGGAIKVDSNALGGTDLRVWNSTFFGNRAAYLGGGAISSPTGNSSFLTNCTIVLNNVGRVLPNDPSRGGGIYGGNFTLFNTLIISNTAEEPYPDLYAVFTSLGHNIIGNQSGAMGTFLDSDELGIADAGLDPNGLQDNGGTGPYHPPTVALIPRPNHPAIDQGDDRVNDPTCVIPNTNPPVSCYVGPNDERGAGYPRQSGPHVDIGAFEYQYTGPGSSGQLLSIARALLPVAYQPSPLVGEVDTRPGTETRTPAAGIGVPVAPAPVANGSVKVVDAGIRLGESARDLIDGGTWSDPILDLVFANG